MRKRNNSLLLAVLALCVSLGCVFLPLPVLVSGAFAGSGSVEFPWIISAASGSNEVKAWLKEDGANGYILCIEGSGRMTESFRDVEVPWKEVKQKIHAVEIGEGVTNVGAYAFNFCRSLTQVLLPESLEEIGTYAFHSTGIKHLIIPAGVSTIGRMIANPSTYYEVLGNPSSVDNHAFSTSLVSALDSATAEALNAKTHVLALIVLDGGIYAETDEELNNLSYGLIAPKKEGFTFGGWYQSADFSGEPGKEDERGRTAVNINHIYYAKWQETVITPTPTPTPEATPTQGVTSAPTPKVTSPAPIVPNPVPTSAVPSPEITPAPKPSKVPETTPDPGVPFIKDESEKNGWDIIKKEIEETKEGNTVTVDMNGVTKVHSTVLDTMKGKDITVIFEMGSNLMWSVNGTSIINSKVKNVDLKVEMDTDHIPNHMVEEVVQGGDSTQLSLSHNGEFGFTAVLSINMGKNNRGRDAALYYYNTGKKKMEPHGKDRVDSQGWIRFSFTHASDYVLVLSGTQSEEPSVTPSPEITKDPETTPEITPNATLIPTNAPTPQLSETPKPTKTPDSSVTPTKKPEDSKSTPAPTPTKVQDAESSDLPVSSNEPTPEPTKTSEPTPTSDIVPTKEPEATKEPSDTKEPETTKEPSDTKKAEATKEPETSTKEPEEPTPTLGMEVSGASETEKNKFPWIAVIGIVVAAGAAAGVVLIRRKSGDKK